MQYKMNLKRDRVVVYGSMGSSMVSLRSPTLAPPLLHATTRPLTAQVPIGCSRYTLQLKKPMGLVLEQDSKTGNIFVVGVDVGGLDVDGPGYDWASHPCCLPGVAPSTWHSNLLEAGGGFAAAVGASL